MDDFRDSLKIVMAPYKVGAMPGRLKTSGDIKKINGASGDNEVKSSALRNFIKKETGGKVEVADSINNENSLLGILRSYMRMKNYGNGNLIPDNVIVYDKDPNETVESGVVGEFWPNGGTKNNKDVISVRNTSLGNILKNKSTIDLSSDRWHPTVDDSVDDTITHELSHGAGFAYDSMPQRYIERVLEDSNKYKGKYSADAIMKNSLAKVIYAVPKIFDVVFGTHIVPYKDEWENMDSDSLAYKLWAQNFIPFNDTYNDVGYDMLEKARDKVNYIYDRKAYEKGEGWDEPGDLWAQAAKNAGFNSPKEANASISGYAKTNYAEAFAEAYSDVLLNGDNAVPYSKELIRLYSEAADKWSKKFKDDDMPMQIDMLKKIMDVSPIKDTLSIKKKGAK